MRTTARQAALIVELSGTAVALRVTRPCSRGSCGGDVVVPYVDTIAAAWSCQCSWRPRFLGQSCIRVAPVAHVCRRLHTQKGGKPLLREQYSYEPPRETYAQVDYCWSLALCVYQCAISTLTFSMAIVNVFMTYDDGRRSTIDVGHQWTLLGAVRWRRKW